MSLGVSGRRHYFIRLKTIQALEPKPHTLGGHSESKGLAVAFHSVWIPPTLTARRKKAFKKENPKDNLQTAKTLRPYFYDPKPPIDPTAHN